MQLFLYLQWLLNEMIECARWPLDILIRCPNVLNRQLFKELVSFPMNQFIERDKSKFCLPWTEGLVEMRCMVRVQCRLSRCSATVHNNSASASLFRLFGIKCLPDYRQDPNQINADEIGQQCCNTRFVQVLLKLLADTVSSVALYDYSIDVGTVFSSHTI